MDSHYKETTFDERIPPEGKYRVLLRDGIVKPSKLYFVGDYDSAEEAITLAETFRGFPDRNGIVTDSKDFPLYPWFDGHQLHTSEDLLKIYGQATRDGRPLTAVHLKAIEAKQQERIPGWKPGHRLVVFWSDISEATGAVARCGDF